MLKYTAFCLLVLFASVQAHGQLTGISGPTVVASGSTQSYFPVGTPPSGGNLVWICPTGGTIITSNNSSCQVQWNGTNGSTGELLLYSTAGGPTIPLSVQIGDLFIQPVTQQVQYGTVPSSLTMVYHEATGSTTYQWYSSPDQATWTPIGTNSSTLTFSSGYTTGGITYYRCVASPGGSSVFATVSLVPFDAGQIKLTTSTQPAYNTVAPVESYTPANGGLCPTASYVYTWWQSVENGPWTSIGTGVNFPAGAPAVVGNTQYMRSVTCSGQTLYTAPVTVFPTYNYPNAENVNYVRVNNIATKGIKTWFQADQLPTGSKFQSTNYIDGLGRTEQTVMKEGSLSSNGLADIVKPYVYDDWGRTTTDYVPYATTTTPGKFKATAVADQQAYLSAQFNTATFTPQTSATINYDVSPLNRILSASSPGAGATMSYQTDFNQDVEKVHVWTISYTTGSLPVTSATATYPSGKLVKKVTIDDKGQQAIYYYDFSGNLILKKIENVPNASGVGVQHAGWLCTYYVYDDFNHLRFSISPRAVVWLDNNNWAMNSNIASALCTRYEYDDRGRCVAEADPAVPEADFIYDDRDRAVYMQDGNGRDKHQWMVNVYDNMDRLVVAGFLNNATYTIAQLQAVVNNQTIGSTPTPITLSSTPVSGPVNLQVAYRDPSVSTYTASQSITFEPGFSSGTNDAFTASIGTTINQPANETVNASFNPIPSGATFVPLAFEYYDGYGYPNAKGFSTDYTFPSNSSPDIEPVQHSARTLGLITGEKLRVINDENYTDDVFLLSTNYFDEKGRLSQYQTDNIKTGVDIMTNQYDFAGDKVAVCEKHTIPGSAYNDFPVITQYSYDQLDRLSGISQQYNGGPVKLLVSKGYDAMGNLSTETYDPVSPFSDRPLTGMTYNYNIQGWPVGINKDYVTGASGNNQWSAYFGEAIGYEDKMGLFNAAMSNGRVAGIAWRSQGDNAERKYDFSYDNAYRMSAANFNQQQSGGTWSNTQTDFSENGVQYDENGNITALTRKGMVPGVSQPQTIDNLSYQYLNNNYSNQLQTVSDNSPQLGAQNGSLGDFKDGTNGTANDYTYDDNGNITYDANRGIGSPTVPAFAYSILDKPYSVTVSGHYQVQYVRRADGDLLDRVVTDLTTNQVVHTSYANGFIFQDANLQYIQNDVGRVRVYQPVNQPRISLGDYQQFPGTDRAVFEFYVKDHLGSVRQVLTEETQTVSNNCTMETTDPSVAAYEESMFGQVDANGNPTAQNEVNDSRVATPAAWSANTSASVSQLQATGTTPQIGPNMLLKVMAGDQVNISANYYFSSPTTSPNNTSLLTSAIQSLVGAFSGGVETVTEQGAISGIESNLGTAGGALDQLLDPAPGNNPQNLPKAGITYLFFDNNFNFIAYDNTTGLGSNTVPVTSSGNAMNLLSTSVKAPQNGYVYVMLSNATTTQPVYFDNFTVVQNNGRLLQEDHYYPYGMEIQALQASAFGKLPSKYRFQGSYNEYSQETGYNEFDLRNYDAQTGRWTTADPEQQFESPYVGMGANPAGSIDPSGGDISDDLGIFQDITQGQQIVANALEGFVIGTAAGALSSKGQLVPSLEGGLVGAGLFSLGDLPWSKVADWVGGLSLWQHGNYWILYDGTNVVEYFGLYSDLNHSTIRKTYKGTSGAEEHQQSTPKELGNPDVGPVPEGDYSINLSLDNTRKAPEDKDGNLLQDEGIDLLPWGDGGNYAGWGQWRARLDKVNVNSTRDNFYFHDSYKGQSHGCIETETDLYYDLNKIRKGMSNIKVQVKYQNPGMGTNGGTETTPRPWQVGTEDRNVKVTVNHVTTIVTVHNVPYAAPNSFPDPSKM